MTSSKVQKTKEKEEYQVSLDEALSLAQGHHKQGNYILAERTYRDILNSVPDHFPTTQFLGILLFQVGNFNEAGIYMKKAIEAEPEDQKGWNNYGGVLTHQQRYEEALECYDKALKIDPDYVDALNNKSYTLSLLDRHKESEACARKALEVAPENIMALNNLGVVLSKRIKFEEALDVWKKASEIDPKEAMVWSNWGNTLREMGRLKESEEKCRKAVEMDPKNPDALNNLANALRDRGKPEEAIEFYRKATDKKPDFYTAHNNLAIALIDNHRFEDAVIAARYAIAFKENFAEGHSVLGKALSEMGEHTEALIAAQRSVQIDPDRVMAYLELADILLVVERLDDAEAAMQEGLKRGPDSPRAYMKLAEIRERMNEFEQAHEAIDKALEMSPNMPAMWARKAMIYYSETEMEKALETINRAIELAPEWPIALQNKAEMLISFNRNDEAEKVVRKVLSITKDLPGPYWVLTSLKKFKSEDDPDFRDLKALEDKAKSYGSLWAGLYHFAMSDAYEQMGKYEESFEHLKQANDLKRQQIFTPDEQKSENVHARIKNRFTKEYLATYENQGYESDLPIFIVGMPRSGTTLTEQIIASHPDVYGAGELPDLSKISLLAATQEGRTAVELGEEYVARIKAREKQGKALRITDKMPANYIHMGLISMILPNAKIIHCRRNPIDTCLSCYKQNFARGQRWSYNLEELAEEYKRYLGLMEHWCEVLPGHFLEIDYEETVNNLEEQARRLIDYVGLKWDDACLEPHKQKRAVLTASKAQVTKPVYKTSVEKWRRYEKQLQPLVRKLMPEEAL